MNDDDTPPQHCVGSEQSSLSDLHDDYIGRLLLQAQRACARQSIARLRARGHERLTLAHTALLPHLEIRGTSATVLAERAGMTKQSMGQLVLDLEEKGYVARGPDPSDRRATLVTFTEEGWRFLRDAREVKKEMETEYLAVLGQRRLDDLRQSLISLIEKSDREKPEPKESD